MRLATFAAALLAFGTTAAYADNERGLYPGVGAGQFNIEVDDLDTTDEIDDAFDGDDTVYKLSGAWRF